MLALAKHVNVSEIDGEFILLDTISGMFFGLNKTGSFILKCLLNGLDISSSLERVSKLWNVSVETLNKDYESLINSMVEKGLLTDD